MSAHTEKLLEEIKKTEAMITFAKVNNDEVTVTQLTETLKVLQKQLTVANDALIEGKQLLKS